MSIILDLEHFEKTLSDVCDYINEIIISNEYNEVSGKYFVSILGDSLKFRSFPKLEVLAIMGNEMIKDISISNEFVDALVSNPWYNLKILRITGLKLDVKSLSLSFWKRNLEELVLLELDCENNDYITPIILALISGACPKLQQLSLLNGIDTMFLNDLKLARTNIIVMHNRLPYYAHLHDPWYTIDLVNLRRTLHYFGDSIKEINVPTSFNGYSKTSYINEVGCMLKYNDYRSIEKIYISSYRKVLCSQYTKPLLESFYYKEYPNLKILGFSGCLIDMTLFVSILLKGNLNSLERLDIDGIARDEYISYLSPLLRTLINGACPILQYLHIGNKCDIDLLVQLTKVRPNIRIDIDDFNYSIEFLSRADDLKSDNPTLEYGFLKNELDMNKFF